MFWVKFSYLTVYQYFNGFKGWPIYNSQKLTKFKNMKRLQLYGLQDLKQKLMYTENKDYFDSMYSEPREIVYLENTAIPQNAPKSLKKNPDDFKYAADNHGSFIKINLKEMCNLKKENGNNKTANYFFGNK